jgi:glycosyltransferase involved in cell wall biosynthesis
LKRVTSKQMDRVPAVETRGRILVITYHFPPDGSVGGLRWGGMSKYLARRGWEVHIVTASPQTGPPEPGVHVHYAPRARTLNDKYNDWVSRRRASAASTPASSAPGASATKGTPPTAPAPRLKGAVAWLRRKLSQALIYPDDGRGWVLRAAGSSRDILSKMDFEAVITSGPPHSAHVAGALACVGRPGLFWVDLRDPWLPWGTTIDKSQSDKQLESIALRVPHPWLERLVFRRVHRIVANTTASADLYRKAYPHGRVLFIPNGVDPERLPSPSKDKFDGRAISYVGTLYLGRDLSRIVQAIKAFVDSRPEARGAIKLHVAGSMQAANEAALWREATAAGLAEMVEVYGRVSGAAALNIINRSHLTLVLAQDQVLQVPAKLYECVAMGVPTLVLAEEGSAAEREAHRIGALACDPDDVEGMRTILERVWLNGISTAVPVSAISYETISGQIEALLRGTDGRSPALESTNTLEAR